MSVAAERICVTNTRGQDRNGDPAQTGYTLGMPSQDTWGYGLRCPIGMQIGRASPERICATIHGRQDKGGPGHPGYPSSTPSICTRRDHCERGWFTCKHKENSRQLPCPE